MQTNTVSELKIRGKNIHGKKSIVVTAKLFFATVKRLAGNERANEGISRIQPK